MQSKTFEYYSKFIPNIKKGEEYNIDINLLHIGSHIKIFAKCDICGKDRELEYRFYLSSYNKRNIYCCSPSCAQVKNKLTNNETYGVDNVFQNAEIKNKIVKTNNKKYGVDYPSQSNEIRQKIIKSLILKYNIDNPGRDCEFREKMYQTCLEKYGDIHFAKTESAKELRIKNGLQIADEFKTESELYWQNVRQLTRKIKKEIFENWNGLDYYDNEYIRDNLLLESKNINYPTIDHKISIFNGFLQNIDPEKIADKENLCITKRTINSTKNKSNSFDFEKLKRFE